MRVIRVPEVTVLFPFSVAIGYNPGSGEMVPGTSPD